MKILIWLAVPLAVTVLAMAWALWTGRSRRRAADNRGVDRPARSNAAYDRFSTAVQKPVPPGVRRLATQQLERPSGIAVRPSQRRSSQRRPR